MTLSQEGAAEAPVLAHELALLFHIGRQGYCLGIEDVREVVPISALLTLTGAPAVLCGLLNLRGEYLPVLDGRVLVGEAQVYDLSNQIIVIGRERPRIGLLVDTVDTVETLQVQTQLHVGTHAAPYIKNVLHWGEESAVLLDVAELASLAPDTTKRPRS